MLVGTRDRCGNPGHPTRKWDMVTRLVRRGRARIWGGGSRPPVVTFLDREFDPGKTVDRRFTVIVWPGYRSASYAVLDGSNLVLRGDCELRIPEIRRKMDERRQARRFRRSLERARRKKKGLPAYNKHRTTDFGVDGKLSATLRHGVEAHLNLLQKARKLLSLPEQDTRYLVVDFRFDVRRITWGPCYGEEYTRSPRGRLNGESHKEFVRRRDERCIACGSDRARAYEIHHKKARKYLGTDLPENKVLLCKDCHELIHTGKLFLPLRGVDYRGLGTINAITGMLRKEPGLSFISVHQVLAANREDSLLGACKVAVGNEVNTDSVHICNLKAYRRHNRAITHAVRDRLYKLDGRIVARNRRPRKGQKGPAWNGYKKEHLKAVARVRVYPGVKLIRRVKTDVQGGNVYRYGQTVFVASASAHNGRSIYARVLKAITGKSYVGARQCKKLTYNQGITPVHPPPC